MAWRRQRGGGGGDDDNDDDDDGVKSSYSHMTDTMHAALALFSTSFAV